MSRFTLRLEGDRGAVLYDRERHRYTRPSAAETFLMLASLEVPRGEALGHLVEAVGELEAAHALSMLEHLGAIEDGRGFEGRVVELPAFESGYAAPLVAHLGLTLACNFACTHCYSSSGTRLPDELTLDEIKKVVDELHAIGCCKLVLGGGEPFLRPELPEVVRYANTLGIDCYVHTNASLLKQKTLEALAKSPPVGLSVSLDGGDAETNDAVRGEGTFDQALAGIELLRAHYPPGFNVSVTIGPRNAGDAVAIVEKVHTLGAKTLMLRPQYPAGEAARGSELCDRDTFARAVLAAKTRAQELGLSLDAPNPLEEGEKSFEGFGCVAARAVLGITPNGRVTPCLNLASSFESGSVREKSLADLWRGGRSFVLVRGQQPNAQCASCKHYDTCRGGCRVRALFAGNGLNGPDSWCHYEPKDPVHPERAERVEGVSLPVVPSRATESL